MQKLHEYKIGYLVKSIIILAIVLVMAGLWGIKKPDITPTTKPIKTEVTNNNTTFNLEIPSLEISAPVIADVNGGDKDVYFKALEGGVAHFAGTAKPGEGGNIFIFGHSSFYFWKAGDYKDIFKNLEDIEIGDEIIVNYKDKKYTYKVTETKVVDPNETSVLEPTATEQLTLMTCVPPGTDEQRLIVIAKPAE